MKSTTIPFAALVAYAAAQEGYGAPAYGQSTTSAPSYSNATMTSSSAASSSTGSAPDCYSKYNECRVAPDANMAYCASQYAGCLGYNPFAGNGTNTVTPGSGYGESSTTEVVSSFTTVCPSPTTLTYGSKTYTVSESTTLTITDCPCTLTKPAMPTPTDVYVTQVVNSFETVCPTPTTFTVPCGSGPAKTYTATESTTLTITECPGGCHVPTPVMSMPATETVTAIVSQYTTYCPKPTTITYGPSTSQITTTVSQPSTITISQCPGGCTVTAPVSAVVPPPAYQPTSPASPVAPSNGTTPASPTGVTPYEGAAQKVVAGGSLFAAAAAAVFFL